LRRVVQGRKYDAARSERYFLLERLPERKVISVDQWSSVTDKDFILLHEDTVQRLKLGILWFQYSQILLWSHSPSLVPEDTRVCHHAT
jgi:hypothetical protein